MLLPLTVGEGDGPATGIASEPVGVAVRPTGAAGTLYLDPDGAVTLSLPLLGVPAGSPVTVFAESRAPWVADVDSAQVAIPAGGTSAELVVRTGTAPGQTFIDLDWGTGRSALKVVVGIPPQGEAPFVFGQPVGVEVQTGP
jgi:hypothetical protein